MDAGQPRSRYRLRVGRPASRPPIPPTHTPRRAQLTARGRTGAMDDTTAARSLAREPWSCLKDRCVPHTGGHETDSSVASSCRSRGPLFTSMYVHEVLRGGGFCHARGATWHQVSVHGNIPLVGSWGAGEQGSRRNHCGVAVSFRGTGLTDGLADLPASQQRRSARTASSALVT
jgi:hypothetical protein